MPQLKTSTLDDLIRRYQEREQRLGAMQRLSLGQTGLWNMNDRGTLLDLLGEGVFDKWNRPVGTGPGRPSMNMGEYLRRGEQGVQWDPTSAFRSTTGWQVQQLPASTGWGAPQEPQVSSFDQMVADRMMNQQGWNRPNPRAPHKVPTRGSGTTGGGLGAQSNRGVFRPFRTRAFDTKYDRSR